MISNDNNNKDYWIFLAVTLFNGQKLNVHLTNSTLQMYYLKKKKGLKYLKISDKQGKKKKSWKNDWK